MSKCTSSTTIIKINKLKNLIQKGAMDPRRNF
jgi:hypothetical protein